MRELQNQLQQLRLGPTVASTPLKDSKPFQGVVEPLTPIVRPTGTIPKPGVNHTQLDDNYQPQVPQPGTKGKEDTTRDTRSTTPGVTGLSEPSSRALGLNQVSDSDSSEEEDAQPTQYQTALDTVINNPALMGTQTNNPSLAHYTTVTQQLPDTTRFVELEHDPQSGLGRLSEVIRELFGGDTIRAALMERALLGWIRVEARRHSELQMAWHREFHPGTRDHIVYEAEAEPVQTPESQITQEPRLRTAAGGGGDPNDPDDDPRKKGSRRQEEKKNDKGEGKRRRGNADDNSAPSKGNGGNASAGGGDEPPRRPTGIVEGFENPDFLEDDTDEDEITTYMRELFGVRPGVQEEEEEGQRQPIWDLPVETRGDGSVDFYKVIDIITKNQKRGEQKVAGSTKDLTVPEFHGI